MLTNDNALCEKTAALWKGGALFEMLDAMFAETAGSVPLLICVVLCGLASMNFVTAPSVSLEGKSLWLMQSLPVAFEIFERLKKEYSFR